jgi:translation initiation factor 3 subunit C
MATHMPIELWISAKHEVDELVAIVVTASSYSVQEISDDYDKLTEQSPAGEDDGVACICGSIINFINQLDDEFVKPRCFMRKQSRVILSV